MADLPDLDKNQISFIAYWNATDHGVDSIDPDEALSAGGVEEYTLYDNGWEGTYTLENQRSAKVRVKNDGWIIVYIDRTESYETNVTDRLLIEGPWDILSGWAPTGTSENDLESPYPASLTNSAFHQAIDSLRSQMSNSGDMVYANAEVGVYDYTNTSATTLTLLTDSNANDQSVSQPTFLYTSGTTRYDHTTLGLASTWAYDQRQSSVSFEGVELAATTGDGYFWGVIDSLSRDLAPSSETEYTTTLEGDFAAACTINQFVTWG